MALFGRRSQNTNRCPECKHYVMVEGYGYCGKEVPAHVNLRMLSTANLKRQCPRCPDEMTCSDWATQ